MKSLIPRILREKLNIKTGTGIATPEAVDEKETLPRDNRVVIFGTNRGGLRGLEKDLSTFLAEKGIQDTELVGLRQIDSIDEGIFGLLPKDGDPVAEPSIPLGVIALPNMRYTDGMGHGMTVETPVEYITSICKQHEIPFVFVEHRTTTADSVAALALAEQVRVPGQLPLSN